MARPKGSKNKKTLIPVEDLDGRIAALGAEIETLTAQLRTKKAELKKLAKVKLEAEQRAAAQKAEADRQKLLEAVGKSGKSIEEILEFLK